jgi:hypothetical protein
MRLKFAIIFLLACFSTALSRDMEPGSLYYNFSLYSLDTLGTTPGPCDEAAARDPNIEWICGDYTQSHEVFIEQWEALVGSDIIRENYNIAPISEWLYFDNDDGSKDFYSKTYRFEDTILLASYNLPDTPEDNIKIFIGVGAALEAISNFADGSLAVQPSPTGLVLDPPFTSSSIFNDTVSLISQATGMEGIPCNEETEALAIKCGLVQVDALRLLLGMDLAFEEADILVDRGDWQSTDDGAEQWYQAGDTTLRVEVITIADNIHAIFFREFAE